MKYFDKEFIKFFSDLEKNNNKEWFHSNKKVYENHVKKPMVRFVTDVVSELQKLDSNIQVDPKKCIGRINRDIRFSKDKTPYKIRSFAHIIKGDKTDPLPVIAFQLGAKDLGIMSGFYTPPKDRLKAIRSNIMDAPKKFKTLYSNPLFIEKYEHIKGDSIKRIPSEYKDFFSKEPLIAKKQFYYVKEFKSDIILTDELLPLIIEYWKVAKPMNDFLSS